MNLNDFNQHRKLWGQNVCADVLKYIFVDLHSMAYNDKNVTLYMYIKEAANSVLVITSLKESICSVSYHHRPVLCRHASPDRSDKVQIYGNLYVTLQPTTLFFRKWLSRFQVILFISK